MSMLSRFATTGGGGDPYWANVSYLLVGNGANGTTTNIKDSSSNNLTTSVVGSTIISTAQSKFSTGSSVYFDGSASGVYVPSNVGFNFGSGSFTVECWVYFTSTSGGGSAPAATLIGSWTAGSNNSWFLYYYSNQLYFTYSTNGSDQFNIGNAWTPSTGGWYFVSFVKSGVNTYMYVNGSQIGSTQTLSGAIANTSANVWTGAVFVGAVIDYRLNGYLYDVRVTKGVARYTGSTMTVPTAPFPTYGP